MAVACLLGYAMARPALAGDEAAQAHYKKGRSLYNISEYRAALDEFKQAYVEHEDPAFLYNIAQCHRQLGNYPEAITFYKRFLNESPKAPNRKEIQRHISELEGKSGEAPQTTPPTPAPTAASPAPASSAELPPAGPGPEAPPTAPVPVDAPPAEPPAPHAGLHLELGLGGGGFHDSFTWLGAQTGTASGASGSFQLAVTYGLLPRFALGVLGAVEAVQSPKIVIGGATDTSVSVGTLGFLGVVADWRLHPGPTGWHFEGALGGARITIKDSAGVVSSNSPSGGGLALAGGYDWALGPSWQLGVLGRLIAVSLSDANTHSVQTVSGLLSVGYH